MVELDTVFFITCLNIVMMNISSVKRIEWHKPATTLHTFLGGMVNTHLWLYHYFLGLPVVLPFCEN